MWKNAWLAVLIVRIRDSREIFLFGEVKAVWEQPKRRKEPSRTNVIRINNHTTWAGRRSGIEMNSKSIRFVNKKRQHGMRPKAAEIALYSYYYCCPDFLQTSLTWLFASLVRFTLISSLKVSGVASRLIKENNIHINLSSGKERSWFLRQHMKQNEHVPDTYRKSHLCFCHWNHVSRKNFLQFQVRQHTKMKNLPLSMAKYWRRLCETTSKNSLVGDDLKTWQSSSY